MREFKQPKTIKELRSIVGDNPFILYYSTLTTVYQFIGSELYLLTGEYIYSTNCTEDEHLINWELLDWFEDEIPNPNLCNCSIVLLMQGGCTCGGR